MIKLQASERKALILNAAVTVANRDGLENVTFANVAGACEIATTPRTVQHYFHIADLREMAARHPAANRKVKETAAKMGII